MRWYFYGRVFFTTAQKRNQASARLVRIAPQRGFTAGAFGNYAAGIVNVDGLDDNGQTVPGFRFCYWTSSEQAAREAVDDVTAAWDVFDGTDSFWAWTAV